MARYIASVENTPISDFLSEILRPEIEAKFQDTTKAVMKKHGKPPKS